MVQAQLPEKPVPAKKTKQVRLPQAPKAQSEQKQAKPGRPKKLKLTSFDQDVLKLIRRGVRNTSEVIKALGVNQTQALERLSLLESEGLLAVDPAHEELTLTVKAYNEFNPPSLQLSTEKKASKKPTTQAPQVSVTQAQPAQQPPLAVKEQPKQQVAKQDDVDLMELLRKGAPKTQEQVQPATQTPTQQPSAVIPPSEKQSTQPMQSREQEDTCPLCKEPFKMSVKGGNPKYGHCFCGAAYHKDCYEGLLEADGKCIRCGRKLGTVMQKETADQMKRIKSVFDE